MFAEKQYARVNSLVAEQAADAKLADEQMSDLAAAVAAERTGSAEILNAKAKLLAAEAAVDQAKADAAEARANVGSRRGEVGPSESQPGLRQDRRARSTVS